MPIPPSPISFNNFIAYVTQILILFLLSFSHNYSLNYRSICALDDNEFEGVFKLYFLIPNFLILICSIVGLLQITWTKEKSIERKPTI